MFNGMVKLRRKMSYICILAIMISFLCGVKDTQAAFVSNLTWSTYPSGWYQDTNGIIGDGNTLIMNAAQSGKDFTYEADIKLNGVDNQASQGGLVIRSSGTSYYQSYIIMLHKTAAFQRIELQKFSGSAAGTVLATADKVINWNTAYHLKIITSGSNIKVYMDSEANPCIDINDTQHTDGVVGLFRAGTSATFNNITLESTPVSVPEPVSHWRFENNLQDSSGNNHGTPVSSPYFTTKDVIDGSYGLYLDGVDDSIEMGDMDIGGNFSLSFWVRPSDIHKNWKPIVSKFNLPSSNTFWLGHHQDDGKIRFGIYLDGTTESYIDTDLGAVMDNRWSQVTCTYDGHYQKIYINGILAKQSSDLNSPLAARTGNFKIAHRFDSLDTYKGVIDDLRLYNTALSASQVSQLYQIYDRSIQDVSLLIDQVGFRTADTKMAVFRSTNRTPLWNPENAGFKLKKKSDGTTVKTGTIHYWGEKWGSHWWTADFTDFVTEGDYYLECEGANLPLIKSNYITIAKDLLVSGDLIQAQIDNLKSRIVNVSQLPTGTPAKPIETGTIWRQAIGVLNANTYALSQDIHIYRDCGGSNMSELESVTITTNALVDILDHYNNQLTTEQIADIKELIRLSANYLVDCQQLSSDPNTNGRMHHMGMGWSEEEIRTYSWRDMPEAITALVRAYKALKIDQPALANEWLNAAKLAYNCMTYRPYYLYSELNGPEGFSNPSWNYNTLMGDLRVFYDKNSSWNMPMNNNMTDLRTRDIFPAIWACTQLYSVDPQSEYLDKAEVFTDIVAGRQFVDYSNTIENTYGNFYEFHNDTDTFTTEMHQWARWSMGNYDPLRLKGVMELLHYRPNSSNAAKWYNMISMYGENYVLKHKELTPFGFTPLTMSRNRGISFFRSLNHGANSIYGLAAINILEIGNFLEDKRYQDLAGRNISYLTGMNPGWPNKRNDSATDWGAFSWVYGVGEASFGGTAHVPPKGSVTNGFTSNTQFALDSMSLPDGPNGIYNTNGALYFHEDGVMHSLSFLNGAIRLEADYSLNVHTSQNGIDVPAAIQVVIDGTTYQYQTDSQGKCIINDLPIGKTGVIRATYNGKEISKNIDIVSSGSMLWNVDFNDYLEVAVTVPTTLSKNGTGICTVSITNHGDAAVSANMNLSSSGVALATNTFSKTINAGATVTEDITITAGNITMPYLVYVYGASSNSKTIGIGSGKVN